MLFAWPVPGRYWTPCWVAVLQWIPFFLTQGPTKEWPFQIRVHVLYLQGRSTLPRRSSSFTSTGSPDSRTATPDAFSPHPYSNPSPTGRPVPTSSSSKRTPMPFNSSGNGSLGRQHGSGSSLDTTAGVQGSPSMGASPLSGFSQAQRSPPVQTRYAGDVALWH